MNSLTQMQPSAPRMLGLLPGLFGGLLLLLYVAGLLFGTELGSQWLSHLNGHGHAHQHAHGHPFADARSWLGIPNAADTLSNLPFALLAFWGAFLQARRGVPLPASSRNAMWVLWLGLLLTACGSALYHWQPTPETLVADRLGMAVAFAGALSLACAGMQGRASSWPCLALLLPAASLAAVLPLQGNLLPWLVVQLGGVLWLLLAAIWPQRPGALQVRWAWVVAGYLLAKGLEMADAGIFEATLDWGLFQVSGHTLKHLAAAAAVWPVVAALRRVAAA